MTQTNRNAFNNTNEAQASKKGGITTAEEVAAHRATGNWSHSVTGNGHGPNAGDTATGSHDYAQGFTS